MVVVESSAFKRKKRNRIKQINETKKKKNVKKERKRKTCRDSSNKLFFIIFVFQGYNNNDKTHTTSDRPCRKTQTDRFLFLFGIVHDGAV